MLRTLERGDATAAERFLEAVYSELRQLASQRLAHEKPGNTLEPTALVHEAYLKLIASESFRPATRAQFFAAAAEAMRRILVDAARRRKAVRHGGEWKRVDLESSLIADETMANELLNLDEALERLAVEDVVKADLVKLRYFAGLTLEDAAGALNISRATASRYWEYARAWLFKELRNH